MYCVSPFQHPEHRRLALCSAAPDSPNSTRIISSLVQFDLAVLERTFTLAKFGNPLAEIRLKSVDVQNTSQFSRFFSLHIRAKQPQNPPEFGSRNLRTKILN
jgi:hypothetical protein